jgi:hypothetical protein
VNAPPLPAVTPATLSWTEGDTPHTARWRSEAGLAPPKRVQVADDTLNADTAYRLACEGTGLLWRGDFHNARQLLQALARRVDRKPRKDRAAPAAATALAQAFHLHRQAQAQRARVLAMVLIPLDEGYAVPLRRAPDLRQACTEAWGLSTGACVASLRELQGLVGAHEWRKKGVPIAALGASIHPHYGVFSPVRGEYLDLVAQAPLPSTELAFDIGTGTGVLAALLAHRGVQRVVATDQDPRALACARDNLAAPEAHGHRGCADGRPVSAGARTAGAVQPALGAGAACLAHRARGVRRRQPHAARLSGRPGGASGPGRRGLAHPVGPGRAPGPAHS